MITSTDRAKHDTESVMCFSLYQMVKRVFPNVESFMRNGQHLIRDCSDKKYPYVLGCADDLTDAWKQAVTCNEFKRRLSVLNNQGEN